ncbi:SIR2 family protein [Desulfotomaculum defluvii]
MTRVYVLGAGAAAAYKGSYLGETSPVANNFFQKAMRVINIHQIRDRYYEDENLSFNQIFQFIERLWGVPRSEVCNSSLDMEEVLTLLNIEMEEDQAGRERLLLAYEEYLLLMALTFDKILYGDLCPYHRKIAESLNPGDSIISFNYELLMDYALQRTNLEKNLWCIQDGYGIPCHYLRGSIDAVHLKQQSKLFEKEDYAKVKFFKLHGSLNWLYCPQCGQLYAYEHSDGGGHSVIINGIANMIQCTTQHCCNKLSRVIIPPTLMKNYQSIPFIPKLWHQARKALELAAEIIVIGYSFPTTDFRSNWMFRKAMVDNKELKKVTIVDKAEGYQLKTLLNKHKSIFRVQDVDFYPDIAAFTQTL